MTINIEEENKKQPRINSLAAEPEKPVLKGNEGSAKAQKSAARLAAVQVLYQMSLNDQISKDALRDFVSNRIGYNLDGDLFVPANRNMLTDIVSGVENRLSDIDNIIENALANGDRADVELLLNNILRAGVYELIASSSVDAGIIINDYMNVTTAFYEGAESKIVNAVLDRVAKQVRE